MNDSKINPDGTEDREPLDWDATPAWSRIQQVAWDVDDRRGRGRVPWEHILSCRDRLNEISCSLSHGASVRRLRKCADDLDVAVTCNPAGTEYAVDTTWFPAIVDTLEEISAELEAYCRARGIVL